MLKPLVIYHDNCADGFGAAFAAWLALGDGADYVPMSYGEDWTIDPRGREVYILDFSFKRDTMDFIFEFAQRVVWLDHHKTAFEAFGLNNDRVAAALNVLNCTTSPHYILLDNNKSGAYLAWEFFHPDFDMPLFIKHIDDYDRWQFKLEGTKAFNKALWSYAPWTFEQWRLWFYDVEDGFNNEYWSDLYAEGYAILRAHDQNVLAVVKATKRECQIPDPFTKEKLPFGHEYPKKEGEHTQGNFAGEVLEGLSANCPTHLTSDVGHELATQSGTFGLCWALGKDGTIANCSLRSNGDYDVSAIAKSFGGGGHRNAAGFQVDIQTLLGWLK